MYIPFSDYFPKLLAKEKPDGLIISIKGFAVFLKTQYRK